MANGHGGYRAPANPAPVSGPGELSRRTDGQPTRPVSGLGYGENQEVNALQGAAPMAQLPRVVPLDAPTEFPGQPITSGAPFGPGPGPSAATGQYGKLTQTLAALLGDDIAGQLEELYLEAEARGL